MVTLGSGQTCIGYTKLRKSIAPKGNSGLQHDLDSIVAAVLRETKIHVVSNADVEPTNNMVRIFAFSRIIPAARVKLQQSI